ncbi:hypothetical protein RJ640_003248, partial [Escallonia rubra]
TEHEFSLRIEFLYVPILISVFNCWGRRRWVVMFENGSGGESHGDSQTEVSTLKNKHNNCVCACERKKKEDGRSWISEMDLGLMQRIGWWVLEAAAKRGLLQSHDSISECLHEAAHFQMPKALRRLFAIILVYCEPNDVRNLWDIHFSSLSEDFLKMSPMTDKMREYKTLQEVDFFLESMGRSITEYDLPTMESTFSDAINMEKR